MDRSVRLGKLRDPVTLSRRVLYLLLLLGDAPWCITSTSVDNDFRIEGRGQHRALGCSAIYAVHAAVYMFLPIQIPKCLGWKPGHE